MEYNFKLYFKYNCKYYNVLYTVHGCIILHSRADLLDISPNPQSNLQPPEKIQPPGLHPIFITWLRKMPSFINKMCHFYKFFAQDGLQSITVKELNWLLIAFCERGGAKRCRMSSVIAIPNWKKYLGTWKKNSWMWHWCSKLRAYGIVM